MLNTVVFTIGSALVATGLGLYLSYLNTRTNIPFKSLFRIISIIPMMIPHILFAVSWLLLLNPSNGLINLFLKKAFICRNPSSHLLDAGNDSCGGSPRSPIATWSSPLPWPAFDVSLEESSKVCGAST